MRGPRDRDRGAMTASENGFLILMVTRRKAGRQSLRRRARLASGASTDCAAGSRASRVPARDPKAEPERRRADCERGPRASWRAP